MSLVHTPAVLGCTISMGAPKNCVSLFRNSPLFPSKFGLSLWHSIHKERICTEIFFLLGAVWLLSIYEQIQNVICSWACSQNFPNVIPLYWCVNWKLPAILSHPHMAFAVEQHMSASVSHLSLYVVNTEIAPTLHYDIVVKSVFSTRVHFTCGDVWSSVSPSCQWQKSVTRY